MSAHDPQRSSGTLAIEVRFVTISRWQLPPRGVGKICVELAMGPVGGEILRLSVATSLENKGRGEFCF